VELAMQHEIQKKLRCQIPQGATDTHKQQLVAVSMLRLMHDSLGKVVETSVGSLTPYELTGFVDSMKNNEGVSSQIDQCLWEIAEENQILEQIQSPYARLMICWSGAIMQSLKKKTGRRIMKRKVINKTDEHSGNVEPGDTEAPRTNGPTVIRV
jgi:hypothetical protein